MSVFLLILTISPGVALFGCKVEIGGTIGTDTSDETASDTAGSSSTTVSSTDSTTATGSTTIPVTTSETTGGGLPGCGDPGSNSHVEGGTCYCDGGFDWCSPDPDDYTCCAVGTSGSDSDTDSGGSTSTGGILCDLQPPPESCDPENELAYCTSTEVECVAESEYFICSLEGEWVPADGSADCTLLGYDFTYGCIDSGDIVEQLCGSGPGTACEGPDTCADDDILNYCAYEKLGAISCLTQCQEVGDNMGVTYDFGSCGEQEGVFACICCDLDEPGCGE